VPELLLRAIEPDSELAAEDECGLFMFNRVIPLLEVDAYRERLLVGLIASVGGVTESTSKSSAKWFLQYLASKVAEEKAGDPSGSGELFLEKIAAGLDRIFYGEDDYAWVPLLNVISLLLANNLYPLRAAQQMFDRTYDLIAKSARNNVPLIRASVSVFMGLLKEKFQDFENVRRK